MRLKMDNNCRICKAEFKDEESLHKHVRGHKVRFAEYYQTYFPRRDLYDQTIIKFKNKEHYFCNDFNSRTNLRLWLERRPLEEAKKYCREILLQRKVKKNLVFSPTHAELKTLTIPGISYYHQIFGDYYKLCEELGFKNRHKKFKKANFDSTEISDKDKIFIDTREQIPLMFDCETESKALKFGDYALSDKTKTCNCYIERKSLADFYGTLSGGYERFNNEIKRAEQEKAYLIVLVEAPMNMVSVYPNQRQVYKKIKATPEFVFYKMREILNTYENIQFLFVEDRLEASRVVKRIFGSNCEYKDYDLQLLYEMGKL